MLRRLTQSVSTLIFSVILASMVWFVAVREQNPPVEANYAPSILLEVVSVPPDMVIFGDIPERTTLRLRAPQSSWDQLSPTKFRAWVDLENLSPGLHDVPVQVEVSDEAVTVVEKRPGTVDIRLEPLAQVQMPVQVEVVDSVPIGYIARTPLVTPITATVSGPASIVDQVNGVVAEVYLRGAKDTISRSVDLSARNPNGDRLNRVIIEPAEADITIPINQRFGYRDVSVRVVIVGEVAPGYWINNITVDPPTVTAVGGPSALNSLPGFVESFPVDVGETTDDITERVALNLPAGVSVVQPETGENGNPGAVQVDIEVTAVEGGQTVQREVTFQGLDETMWAVAHPAQVDVILSGPLPRLHALTLQDVTVIADLFGLGVGVHKVKPTIVAPETLRVQSVLPDTVEVEISARASPSPPPTQTATATRPALTATVTITTTKIPTHTETTASTPAPGQE